MARYSDRCFDRIDKWMQSALSNYALEAPTGTGKTGIALAHGYFQSILSGERTVICVATVQEQKQYTAAFKEPYNPPDWFASLSGRGRYMCKVTGKSEGDSSPKLNHSECEYTAAVKRAQNSDVLVVNYALARIGFRRGGELFGSNSLRFTNMILDECHDIHKIMEDWFAFRMTDTQWKDYVWSDFGDFENKYPFWNKYSTSDEYRDDILNIEERAEAAEDDHYINPTNESRRELRRVQAVQQHLEKLPSCVRREDVFTAEDKLVALTPAFPPPLEASQFYGNADRRLFMSGTILASESGFRRGIGMKECEVTRMDNPFPPKKSPLFFIDGPSLAYKTREQISKVYSRWDGLPSYAQISANTPEAIRILDIILDKHDGRVMVHAHSNMNAKTIGMFSEHRDRMIIHDSSDWDGMFREYLGTPGAVLVAAGRTEAIDLPGELCNAVVIYKLPYAPFSEVEKARQKLSPSYYTASMLQTIRQARGRGVRSHNDECPCYVIESNGRNYTRNSAFRGVLTKMVDPPPVK